MPTKQLNIRLDDDEYDLLVTIREVLLEKTMTSTMREVIRQGTKSIITSESFQWLYERAKEKWAANLVKVDAWQTEAAEQEDQPADG